MTSTGIRPLLHCSAVEAIMDGNTIKVLNVYYCDSGLNNLNVSITFHFLNAAIGHND